MTNGEILKTAMRQSAVDMNCRAEDFLTGENKIVISEVTDGARKYLNLPNVCDIVSYGSNVVASVRADIFGAVKDFLMPLTPKECFELSNILKLNQALSSFGVRINQFSEHFLPDLNNIEPIPCEYETRLLQKPDFAGLYKPEWSNAISIKRPENDVLGVGAYDRDKLVGFAGCSADCGICGRLGLTFFPNTAAKGLPAR